jgi:signal transduction histidine kinase
MGDLDRSLEYFLKGLGATEAIENKEAHAYAYNGAGYVYCMLGDSKKALDFLERALVLSREMNNYDLLGSVLDSLALSYRDDGQLDKAFETYRECLELSEASSQKVNEAYALLGMGDVRVRQNRLDEARKYFLKSLTIRTEIGYKVGEANSLLQLGKLDLSQKNLSSAKEYLFESLKVAESIKAKAAIYEAHEALAGLYEQQRDFNSFVHHYKLYNKYKSEVFREEQESKQKYVSMQYEMEKLQKETEISRLTNVVLKDKNEELERKKEELEQSYNSISVLSKIGQDITSTLNLDVILNTVYENVNELMSADIFGIGIYNEAESEIEYRLAIENGKRYLPYRRSMENKNQFPVWCIENKKEVFINDAGAEYQHYLTEYVEVVLSLEDGTQTTNPVSLVYLPLMIKEKVIGLITVQSFSQNAYTSRHLDILKTLASYTAAALYNAQAFETVENTLKELKVTQAQLIQSEKMASLGEMTAGIAHEIQNPLNFVNNFSDVNAELIDEAGQEIDNGNMNEAKEILNNIKHNEQKINHHGKRADAIVKGMLQHSKTSGGQKETTDINALCDEYLRLAYHGLRAKQKSFNADFRTDFDTGTGKVDVVPQDIGRVLLNLYNNAFFAVNEKKKQTSTGSAQNGYEPIVSVGTRRNNGMVEIRVADNGNGIPQKILDKIFQPFFTTKPTGEGTGLGLSLSYDIIKAHGGEIKVETREGEGSAFIVQLPQ